MEVTVSTVAWQICPLFATGGDAFFGSCLFKGETTHASMQLQRETWWRLCMKTILNGCIVRVRDIGQEREGSE